MPGMLAQQKRPMGMLNPSGGQSQAPNMFGSIPGQDFRQSIVNAYQARQNPMLQRQETDQNNALVTDLRARGIQYGSPQWNEQMQRMRQDQSTARNDANASAMIAAGQEAIGLKNADLKNKELEQQMQMQKNLFGHETQMQGNLFGQQSKLQGAEFGHEKGMQEALFGQQSKMQGAQFGHEKGMQEDLFGQQSKLQANEFGQQTAIQKLIGEQNMGQATHEAGLKNWFANLDTPRQIAIQNAINSGQITLQQLQGQQALEQIGAQGTQNQQLAQLNSTLNQGEATHQMGLDNLLANYNVPREIAIANATAGNQMSLQNDDQKFTKNQNAKDRELQMAIARMNAARRGGGDSGPDFGTFMGMLGLQNSLLGTQKKPSSYAPAINGLAQGIGMGIPYLFM